MQCMVIDCAGGSGRITAGQPLLGDRSTDLGSYLRRAAYLEALAVQAFERLADELELLSAPRRFIRRARRAARQEQGHARALGSLAERHGAAPPPVSSQEFPVRSAWEMAEENAREGCIRETWGAAVMAHQARQARAPELRRALVTIAREEEEHAQLGWDLATWFCEQLSPSMRRRLRVEQRRAVAQVRPSAFRDPAPDLIEQAGLPTAAQAGRLWSALRAGVWHVDGDDHGGPTVTGQERAWREPS